MGLFWLARLTIDGCLHLFSPAKLRKVLLLVWFAEKHVVGEFASLDKKVFSPFSWILCAFCNFENRCSIEISFCLFLESSNIKNSRHQIDVENDFFSQLSSGNRRSSHVEWNTTIKIVRKCFSFDYPELTKVIAVVGSVHKVSIVHLISCFDGLHDTFDAIVDRKKSLKSSSL